MTKTLAKLLVVAAIAVVGFTGTAQARSEAGNAGACSGAHLAWAAAQKSNPQYAGSAIRSMNITDQLDARYRTQPDYLVYQNSAIKVITDTLSSKGARAAGQSIAELGQLCGQVGYPNIQL